MSLGPQALVTPSPLVPPSVSLLTAAITVDETNERWVNGILYTPEGCGAADVIEICDHDPQSGAQKTAADSDTEISGTPIGIVASDTCTTRGFQSRDFKARANRMLLAVESYYLARDLWEGTSGLNVHLTQPGLATTAATNVSPRDVIGTLETAFFDTSPAPRAMIHMSPKFLERLMFESGGAALRREGNVYYTWMDSVVAVDKGYRGKGPNNVGGEWVYITPVVQIRRGPISYVPEEMSEAVLRRENKVTFFAERALSASFNYNCQPYTVSVNLT